MHIEVADHLPQVPLDFALMELGLCNLLMHCHTRSPEEDSIAIHAEIENDSLVICIVDTGECVPEDVLTLVVQQLAPNPDFMNGEPGQGLIVVKTIVELHDGKIKIANKDPRGAEFWLWLPLQDKVNPHKAKPWKNTSRF